MLTSSDPWLKLTVSFAAHICWLNLLFKARLKKGFGKEDMPISQVFLLAGLCAGHWCVSLLIVWASWASSLGFRAFTKSRGGRGLGIWTFGSNLLPGVHQDPSKHRQGTQANSLAVGWSLRFPGISPEKFLCLLTNDPLSLPSHLL